MYISFSVFQKGQTGVPKGTNFTDNEAVGQKAIESLSQMLPSGFTKTNSFYPECTIDGW